MLQYATKIDILPLLLPLLTHEFFFEINLISGTQNAIIL